MRFDLLAGPTGFEPAISSVTGRRVRPATPRARVLLRAPVALKNRGNDTKRHVKLQSPARVASGVDVLASFFSVFEVVNVRVNVVEIKVDVSGFYFTICASFQVLQNL